MKRHQNAKNPRLWLLKSSWMLHKSLLGLVSLSLLLREMPPPTLSPWETHGWRTVTYRMSGGCCTTSNSPPPEIWFLASRSRLLAPRWRSERELLRKNQSFSTFFKPFVSLSAVESWRTNAPLSLSLSLFGSLDFILFKHCLASKNRIHKMFLKN